MARAPLNPCGPTASFKIEQITDSIRTVLALVPEWDITATITSHSTSARLNGTFHITNTNGPCYESIYLRLRTGHEDLQ